MNDLFDLAEERASGTPVARKSKPKPPTARQRDYSAKDIEVLEGLEPVRRHPGMFIGGTDEEAMHHLVAETLDNAMDEAVVGHANRIDLHLAADQTVTVSDNGRGIPIDPHPKFKTKSALEVIMTTLHSGGKFGGKVYQTSGGLHGVGISVVNALSDRLSVEIARDRKLWTQAYKRGKPLSPLTKSGPMPNRRGTTVRFHPDPRIFGPHTHFRPARLYRMACSKAYLFRGVEIRWSCDAVLLKSGDTTPQTAALHFPGGLADYLATTLADRRGLTQPFSGAAKLNNGAGRVEWAVAWPADEENLFNSYCNTVPTPQGGTHETGLKTALTKGLKAHAELVDNKQAAKINAEDVTGGACVMLSVFIENPQFQGQTKDKLTTPEAARLIEACAGDHFDHWLSGDPETARVLLERVIERAEERLRRRKARQGKRAAARRTRLPGKLTDCTRDRADAGGTELFLVEGDSAGGSAKQARDRETQAVLPLRGKILNVASTSADKLNANQELRDLIEALGCGTQDRYDDEQLRYERVIIMTDADVDGAHIASLLMTFFYLEMRQLIENDHLFIALPPLYRITQGGKSLYARDDAHKDELLKSAFNGKGKIEISRFKGLGEMPSSQLRETTMDPAERILLRVTLPESDKAETWEEAKNTAKLVDSLMGRKPKLRLAYIQEQAPFVEAVDV